MSSAEPPTWRRPRSCGEAGCLEVTTDLPSLLGGDIAIRSNRRSGTVVVDRAEFAAFVVDVKAGIYDDLCEVRDGD